MSASEHAINCDASQRSICVGTGSVVVHVDAAGKQGYLREKTHVNSKMSACRSAFLCRLCLFARADCEGQLQSQNVRSSISPMVASNNDLTETTSSETSTSFSMLQVVISKTVRSPYDMKMNAIVN